MATPETFRALLAANAMPQRSDLSHRTKNLSNNFNQFLYKSAHEPSLAGHRIQEHVYKVVPSLANERTNIAATTRKLDGTLFDLNYTVDFLNKLDESSQNSSNTREIVSELASKISSASSRANKTNGTTRDSNT